ncbi:putative ABC transporter ATP-binding protein YbhF [mine drainage metagenome]|uniref:Putative ABC transporter ATP-binding protein YbhF n=1 Tax=mine drainage metagenome TaxID=410659 RepID=A0A1J5RD15_9ZZZZ
MSALRLADIDKTLGARRVLDGLNLTIEQGEIYGLLGPNGSGKSTAINILCNLLDPDRGTVEIDGRPASAAARTALGICPQDIALYRDLYPAENLRFFAEIYGLAPSHASRRIAELVGLFGLETFARTPVSALSGGWQRRVNIAVALVHAPTLLVLDEPTAAVDVKARQELWLIIEALKKEGMTILLTTHHLEEAERLCSRVGILKDGRLAREGTIPEILALVPAQAIALIDAADPEKVRARARELGWALRDYAGRMACLLPRQSSLEETAQALRGVGASSISLQRVSLEHAYLDVVQGA